MSDMSLHNDPIRKDNEPEPKAFTHISTHISQENQRCITGISPPSNETIYCGLHLYNYNKLLKV